MPTYTAGQYTFTQSWNREIDDPNYVFIYTTDLQIVELNPGSPEWPDFLTSGATPVPKPSIYHTYDVNIEDFFFNQSIFTPDFLYQMDIYREQKIASEVNYNNGTTLFSAINTSETRSALQTIANGIEIVNDDNLVIDFKLVGDMQWATMTPADAQGFYKACFLRQQACFSAERHVHTIHQTTPYTSIDAAKADFDDYLTV